MPNPATTTVQLVIVRASSHLHALLVAGHNQRRHAHHTVITVYQTLTGFLNEHNVPADTPVARLDVLDPQLENDFTVSGPMPATFLPVGTVSPPERTVMPYRGQPWHELGMLSYVSIDVYLSLACQVGGTICLAGDITKGPTRPAKP